MCAKQQAHTPLSTPATQTHSMHKHDRGLTDTLHGDVFTTDPHECHTQTPWHTHTLTCCTKPPSQRPSDISDKDTSTTNAYIIHTLNTPTCTRCSQRPSDISYHSELYSPWTHTSQAHTQTNLSSLTHQYAFTETLIFHGYTNTHPIISAKPPHSCTTQAHNPPVVDMRLGKGQAGPLSAPHPRALALVLSPVDKYCACSEVSWGCHPIPRGRQSVT